MLHQLNSTNYVCTQGHKNISDLNNNVKKHEHQFCKLLLNVANVMNCKKGGLTIYLYVSNL